MDYPDPLSSVGYLISWAARLSARLIDQELKSFGIAPGYLPVLFSLGNGGAMLPSALAKAAAVENPTMTNTLARMERDGLIRRDPHPTDGRSTLVSCSPETVALWQSIKPLLQHLNHEILSGLPEDRRAAFLDDLSQVVTTLGALCAGSQERNAEPG